MTISGPKKCSLDVKRLLASTLPTGNPTYERGPDRSLLGMGTLPPHPNSAGHFYQPLVVNSKLRADISQTLANYRQSYAENGGTTIIPRCSSECTYQEIKNRNRPKDVVCTLNPIYQEVLPCGDPMVSKPFVVVVVVVVAVCLFVLRCALFQPIMIAGCFPPLVKMPLFYFPFLYFVGRFLLSPSICLNLLKLIPCLIQGHLVICKFSLYLVCRKCNGYLNDVFSGFEFKPLSTASATNKPSPPW